MKKTTEKPDRKIVSEFMTYAGLNAHKRTFMNENYGAAKPLKEGFGEEEDEMGDEGVGEPPAEDDMAASPAPEGGDMGAEGEGMPTEAPVEEDPLEALGAEIDALAGAVGAVTKAAKEAGAPVTSEVEGEEEEAAEGEAPVGDMPPAGPESPEAVPPAPIESSAAPEGGSKPEEMMMEALKNEKFMGKLVNEVIKRIGAKSAAAKKADPKAAAPKK